MIQDWEYLPSSSWICLISAYAMDASRSEAYFVALTCPRCFACEHAYTLFFSGGARGRVFGTFDLCEHQDVEWLELNCEQAKVYATRRADVGDAPDTVHELRPRGWAAAAAVADLRMPGAPNFPVAPDSDSENVAGPAPVCPSAFRVAIFFRKATGFLDDGSDDLPLLVQLICTEPDCDKAGNVGMVPCSGGCEGVLYTICGEGRSDPNSARTCSLRSGATLGKRRVHS